jgi:uncharacterized protein YhbP (UPF0306 family)
MFSFKFNHPEYSNKILNESLYKIIENNKLLSMATVTQECKAHINTAYYAYDNNLKLYIITDPKSNHSNNVKQNESVSVSIFNSHLQFLKDDMQGIQLFGKCYKTPKLKFPKGTSCFIKRFPVFKGLVTNPEDFAKKAATVKLYTIEVLKIKLFDEERFGKENFIALEVS